jgi:hypothetical protein
MSVTSINITIEQGEDFSSSFVIRNQDESIATLSNYSVLSTLKKHPKASVGISFTTSLNTSTSVVTIGMGRTDTSSLSPGRHYYDVFLVSPQGKRTKSIEGNVLVNPSATLVS